MRASRLRTGSRATQESRPPCSTEHSIHKSKRAPANDLPCVAHACCPDISSRTGRARWKKLEDRPIRLSIAQFVNMSDRAAEVRPARHSMTLILIGSDLSHAELRHAEASCHSPGGAHSRSAPQVITCDRKRLTASAISRLLLTSVGRLRACIYDIEVANDRVRASSTSPLCIAAV